MLFSCEAVTNTPTNVMFGFLIYTVWLDPGPKVWLYMLDNNMQLFRALPVHYQCTSLFCKYMKKFLQDIKLVPSDLNVHKCQAWKHGEQNTWILLLWIFRSDHQLAKNILKICELSNKFSRPGYKPEEGRLFEERTVNMCETELVSLSRSIFKGKTPG